MKKIIVLLFSLILILGLSACGSGGSITIEESKTLALFQEVDKSGKLHIKMAKKEGSTETEAEAAVDGDNSYAAFDSGLGESMVIITKGDQSWVLYPSQKRGNVMEGAENQVTLGDLGFDLNLVDYDKNQVIETGRININGEDYDYESFPDETSLEERRIKYVYDGNQLVYLIAETEEDGGFVEEGIIKIQLLETDVDASLFDIPADYDITEM